MELDGLPRDWLCTAQPRPSTSLRGPLKLRNGGAWTAQFVAGDFYEYDFPRAQFDIAICVETISTVPDQPRLISRLATGLKPGGYLILTSQNKFVYQRRSDIRPPEPGKSESGSVVESSGNSSIPSLRSCG